MYTFLLYITCVHFRTVKTVDCFFPRASLLCLYQKPVVTRFLSIEHEPAFGNFHNTHPPSFFLLCRCSIEDIFHGWGAHRIRYQALISFHGDGGYTQLYKRINLRSNLWFKFHLFIIEEHQRKFFSFIIILMGNMNNWEGRLNHLEGSIVLKH